MDHNIHHRRLTPQSYNKPEQLDEMSPGFVRNARMGLAARAGRLATKTKPAPTAVKAVAPTAVKAVAPTAVKAGAQTARIGTKRMSKGSTLRHKGAAAVKAAVHGLVAPMGVTRVAHAVRTLGTRVAKAAQAVGRVRPLSSWAQTGGQRARTAKPKPTASDILASSEKQNQRAREALGPGRVDFEKRLSNVKPGQTKASDWDPNSKSKYVRRRASGESHADIMAQSRANTQSMRDELAQIKGRIADKDRASVIRGARKAGGLRTRITPEQQANRDRASVRVQARKAGQQKLQSVIQTILKPGDKASKPGRPGPNHGRRRAANEIARNLKLGRHPYDDRRYYSDYTGD